jgi:hypothetical protein
MFWALSDVTRELVREGPVSSALSLVVASLVSTRAVELARKDVSRDVAAAMRFRFGHLEPLSSLSAVEKKLEGLLKTLRRDSTRTDGHSIFLLPIALPRGATRDPSPPGRFSFTRTARDSIDVGIIQPRCNFASSETWDVSRSGISLRRATVERDLWPHIQTVLREWTSSPPDLIVLPEYCLPRSRFATVTGFAASTGTVVVAGMEYRSRSGRVRNEAAVIVPWAGSRSPLVFFVPKCFPAPLEAEVLARQKLAFEAGSDRVLFDIPWIGQFSVSICYDLYCLDTFEALRGRVTHLFAPAFNKDIATFDALAEAGMRLLFANVVVANSGHYGGSVALSPYYEVHRREVLRFRGNGLETALRIRLPLEPLEMAQRGMEPTLRTLCGPCPPGDSVGCPGKTEREFKRLPAGWDRSRVPD